MRKDYKKHIASNSDYQVWLHRTHTSNIESILKNGLRFGAGDLSSTATLQSENLEIAERNYQLTHKGNNAVVVIKIPQKVAEKYFQQKEGIKGVRQLGYESDKDVTYFDGEYIIQKKHIHGWIDKKMNEYHPNPYLSEPQNLTDIHFPPEFYGGLEKDIMEEKPKNKPKKEVRKKILSENGLPPPLKNYHTVP